MFWIPGFSAEPAWMRKVFELSDVLSVGLALPAGMTYEEENCPMRLVRPVSPGVLPEVRAVEDLAVETPSCETDVVRNYPTLKTLQREDVAPGLLGERAPFPSFLCSLVLLVAFVSLC